MQEYPLRHNVLSSGMHDPAKRRYGRNFTRKNGEEVEGEPHCRQPLPLRAALWRALGHPLDVFLMLQARQVKSWVKT